MNFFFCSSKILSFQNLAENQRLYLIIKYQNIIENALGIIERRFRSSPKSINFQTVFENL